MYSHCQYAFGRGLANHVLIQVSHNLTRGGNFVEQVATWAATFLLLIQNGLAKLDTFAANVDIPWTFDQWPDVSIALAAKRAKSVLFVRTATATTTT
jgi:hypothetical protein